MRYTYAQIEGAKAEAQGLGRYQGARDERQRIRRELLEAWPNIIDYPQPMAKGPWARFRAALDKIAPEEG